MTADDPGIELERAKRLSESMMWSSMRRYYEQRGPAAWHSGEVPLHATNNPFIAKAYAQATIAYLSDARAAGQIDQAHPIYLVELGAGIGRFAFLFLRKWRELKAESAIRDLDVRYVMTDFAPTTVKVWTTHTHLAPFVADKTLAFGLFDVDRDREIRWFDGSGVLSPATVKNPMVVFGNAAFSAFSADLFTFGSGGAREVRVALHAPTGTTERTPNVTRIVTPAFSEHPIATPYYDDPALERTLAMYRERLSDTMITIPLGGARAMRTLLELSHDRLLLLASDKGFSLQDELYQRGQAAMEFHGGAFSLNVNFHALAHYIRERGGWSIGTPRRTLSLKTLASIVGGDERAFASTRVILRELFEFGPGEYAELFESSRTGAAPTLPQFLGLLRLGGHDPELVADFAALLRKLAANLSELGQLDLRIAIDRAWQNHYPGPANLPFEIARILMVLHRPVEAAKYNLLALEWFGDHPSTRLNLGIAYYYSERPADALVELWKALELEPGFPTAREWISRIQAETELGIGSALPADPADGAPITTFQASEMASLGIGAKTSIPPIFSTKPGT